MRPQPPAGNAVADLTLPRLLPGQASLQDAPSYRGGRIAVKSQFSSASFVVRSALKHDSHARTAYHIAWSAVAPEANFQKLELQALPCRSMQVAQTHRAQQQPVFRLEDFYMPAA
ncbi:hypothetical protein PSPO01_11252 [Paraphaeosphaeria sporulosa]